MVVVLMILEQRIERIIGAVPEHRRNRVGVDKTAPDHVRLARADDAAVRDRPHRPFGFVDDHIKITAAHSRLEAFELSNNK
jgi:hypothetical protein